MGSLATIASADLSELMTVEGISRNAALGLKLLSYLNSRSITDEYAKPKRYTERELSRLILGLFTGLSKETVYCLSFDSDMRLIGTDYLGEGTVNSSEVYPRRVLECACRRGAEGIIIAHNHPRGAAKASDADMAATSFIYGILKSAGISLLGHYLVSDTDCVKMAMDF